MGDKGAARYELALHPSSPTIRVLSYVVTVRDPLTPVAGPGSLSVKAHIPVEGACHTMLYTQ